MSSLTTNQAGVLNNIVNDLLSDEPTVATLDMMDTLSRDKPKVCKWLRAKVRHLKKSKVEQAVIMKKIERAACTLLIAGVTKVRGCKRFAPRKCSSTTKKLTKKLRRLEERFLATGQRPCDWQVFMARICETRGLQCCFF